MGPAATARSAVSWSRWGSLPDNASSFVATLGSCCVCACPGERSSPDMLRSAAEAAENSRRSYPRRMRSPAPTAVVRGSRTAARRHGTAGALVLCVLCPSQGSAQRASSLVDTHPRPLEPKRGQPRSAPGNPRLSASSLTHALDRVCVWDPLCPSTVFVTETRTFHVARGTKTEHSTLMLCIRR